MPPLQPGWEESVEMRIDTYICKAECLCCASEISTRLLIAAIQSKIKNKENRKII